MKIILLASAFLLLAGCSRIEVDCTKGTVTITGEIGRESQVMAAAALANCPKGKS